MNAALFQNQAVSRLLRMIESLLPVLAIFAAVPSGVFAEAPLPTEMSVELAPVIIEDSTRAKWLYAEAPGLQVLSRCSDSFTRRFVIADLRLHAFLEQILPAEYQARFSTPRTLLLTNEASAPEMAKRLLADGTFRPKAKTPQTLDAFGLPVPTIVLVQRSAGEKRSPFRILPNLQLEDPDLVMTFAVVDEADFDDDAVRLTASHVNGLMERHTPALPIWLVEAVRVISPALHYSAQGISLPRAFGATTQETIGLQRDPTFPRTLLPMSEFFGGPTETNRAIWDAQAVLLLRWASDPKNQPMRERFWKFIGRSSVGDANETAFLECFGFGYSEMRNRLSDYLEDAIKDELLVKPAAPFRPERPRVRTATAEEVARIKGDWERLAVKWVREEQPSLASAYEHQVRLTLGKIKVVEQTDPAFLAALGIFQCTEGDDVKARPQLEAAAQAKVARPRVYGELARIRFSDAKAGAAANGGKLTAEQVEFVLEPLAKARELSPALPFTYLLTAEVLLSGGATPTAAQLAVAAEGVRLFPHEPQILLRTAVLYGAHGRTAEALELVHRGLRLSANPDERRTFLQLERTLARSNN